MTPVDIARIHLLFNELHRELDGAAVKATEHGPITEGIACRIAASRLDALHHDFTHATTLNEEVS